MAALGSLAQDTGRPRAGWGGSSRYTGDLCWGVTSEARLFSRALRPPGWLPEWHCGVRVVSSKKLVGFISAIPATIHIYDT